jgi:hypothetical protein
MPKLSGGTHLANGMFSCLVIAVYARLPDRFWLQASCYATHILNVLPVRGHNNEEETPSTPYELFFGQKPSILSFRVFGCPGVIQRWSADERSNGKQTERGMRGIFIGFHDNQKGFLFYMPGSHNTIITGDATEIPSLYNRYMATSPMSPPRWNRPGQLSTPSLVLKRGNCIWILIPRKTPSRHPHRTPHMRTNPTMKPVTTSTIHRPLSLGFHLTTTHP